MSQEAGQVSGIPISKNFQVFFFSRNFQEFVVIHIVNGFGIVNKAEIDVFLELSCFFDNPLDPETNPKKGH